MISIDHSSDLGLGRLTSDTPFSTEVVVDVYNDGTDKETRDITDGVEKTKTSPCREVEVFLPGVKGLQAGNQVTVICSVRRLSAT